MSKSKKIMRKLKIIMLAAIFSFAVAGMISGNAMAATKWKVTPTAKTINVDNSVTLKSNKNVKWTISKGSKVVKLTSKQAKSVKVTGLKTGTATVKAKNTATGATKTVKITVVPELTLTASKKTVEVGKTVTLKTSNNVKWSISEGTKVVKFTSKNGKTAKISALKAGTAKIKAVDKKTGSYKTIKITVVPKLKVSSTDLKLNTGKYKTLTANNDVKWTVKSGSEYIKLSNKEKKSVRITGLKKGVAYVKAENTKTGSYKTIKITVSIPTASSDKISKVLSGEDTVTKLIDARNSDAYAGWALDEATRGGHFEGAMNLDAAWIGNAKLDGIIADNGISEDGTYIVYDTNGKDAVAMAEYLNSMGIAKVSTYNAVNEINGDAELVSYANYDLTVPASIVKNISDNVVNGTELNDTAKAIVGDSKNIVILECSWGGPEDTNYIKNHVPGALHIDTNETDPPGVYVEAENEQYLYDYKYEWRLGSDEHLIKLFSSRGVTKDSCVIVTGSSAAPVSRCGIILKYIGVENVRIMSKGYNDWKAAGYEFESVNRNAELPNGPEAIDALSATEAAEKFGASTALHPEIYEKTATVIERLGDDDYQLVDNRRQEEWDGLSHGYDYEDLTGRIDGSIHSQQNSYNPDNSMRSKLLQDAKWTGDGIDLSKHMTFFCGDGWRAAVDTWNAWVLGYDASIYHGWMEWANSGCEFINKDGLKVHYDKDLQAVVDSEGTIVQKLTMKLQFEKDEVAVNETGTYEELNVLINKTGIDAIYSSSDESIVKVAADGTVEVLYVPDEETKVEITALVKDFDNNYMGPEDRSVTYTISVKKITKEDVLAYGTDGDDNTVLVDARLADVYQGWAVDGNEVGGHLEGAVNVSAQWLDCSYSSNKKENKTREEHIQKELDALGMTADKKYMIYDTNGEDAKAVAVYLKELGFVNVSTYNANELVKEAKLVSYANYDLWIPAEVVKNISDHVVNGTGLSAVAANVVKGDDIVLLDVSWGTVEESGFLDGHVPGSVHVNTDDYETPKIYIQEKDEPYRSEWRLNSDEELLKLAANSGITKDSCVIITGYEPMATTRMGIILKYLGCDNVHVMSEAFVGWDAMGYEYETGERASKAVESFGVTEPQNPDLIDTIEEAEAKIGTVNYQLIDTRTIEEWNGESSGYGYHDLAGRIVGTVHSPSGIGYSSSMYYYRNPDKSMRSKEALEAMWASQGIDPNKHMAFFCGSGWRAAEETWDALVLGYTDVSLYSDGWIGWSNEGKPYIDKDGNTVRYDKATNSVVSVE